MRLTSSFECMFVRKNRLERHDVVAGMVADMVADFWWLRTTKKFSFSNYVPLQLFCMQGYFC